MSMIGKSLAHYEIAGLIGKGGMGEVYQAKDRKLGRDVAIKVLPEEFARDAERVARFQREAKLLASLNHPNIASIYGLEESEGTHFLVLELIEGQTLADRIKAGPIAVEEALKLGLQIAEALEAAHEKGVIHRDLKPSNIKVTPDGKVKVLDFGLAKAFAGDPSDMDLSNSPTLSDAATRQGVILGTAAYMSPEQARGKPVDKRADIWAFGVVLFEMLIGRQIFSGDTVSDTLASVLAREPEWKSLPPNLHPRIRFLLERCLKKDPKDRYSGISDARVDIREVLSDPGGLLVQPGTAVKPKSKLRLGVPWVAAAIALTALIIGAAVWYLKPVESREVMRFDYELPTGQQFMSLDLPSIAVSPDGKQFVYGTPEGLYLRPVNELTAKLIAGTEGLAGNPFFSPDGKWIGYFSIGDQKLKKISINGGAPVALCDFRSLYFVGACWQKNDTILFGQIPGPIMRVSANGGNPEAVTESVNEAHTGPQILPGEEYLMYTAQTTNQRRVLVQSLKSGEIKELFAGFAAWYVPTGHIIYRLQNSDNLFAVPFDLDRLEVTGGAVPIAEKILQYAVADAGTLVCIPGTGAASSSGGRTLVWVNREGKEDPLGAKPNMYQFPKISPDGTQVALTVDKSGNQDIYIWDTAHKTLERLTFNDSSDSFPVWTPDSKQIIFRSTREKSGIYSKAADGTGEAEQIAPETNQAFLPFCLSGDGSTLVIQQVLGMTQIDIGMLSLNDDHTHKPLLQEDYIESHPQVSPDGKWIAYCSVESDRPEIFVRPFPDVNEGKWQISANGGNSPLWSPDSRELYYLIGDTVAEAAMRVAIDTEPIFKHGKPEELFRGAYVGYYPGDFPWSIHPDGKRFLMMKQAGNTGSESANMAPPKIIINLNWFEELKQRVPVD